MPGERCIRCDGCGQVADSDQAEPWTFWSGLPLRSATAVLVGLVRPVPCPVCKGRGTVGLHCASCTCEAGG